MSDQLVEETASHLPASDEPGSPKALSLRAKNLVLEFVERRRTKGARDESFNVLSVLNLGRDEVRHSRALAWFIDEQSQHGLGSVALRALNDAAKILVAPEELTNYKVRTEYQAFDSRIDIVIYRPGRFVIAVENKIDASEGSKQADREYGDLGRLGQALNVPTDRRLAIFLTRSGARPTGDSAEWWYPLSYKSLALSLEAICLNMTSGKAHYFLEDWLELMARFGVDDE